MQNKNPARRSKRDYRDFEFRRRHDHFLNYRIQGEKQDKIIEIAAELGFNLETKDFKEQKKDVKRKKGKKRKNNRGSFFQKLGLKTLLNNIFKRSRQ